VYYPLYNKKDDIIYFMINNIRIKSLSKETFKSVLIIFLFIIGFILFLKQESKYAPVNNTELKPLLYIDNTNTQDQTSNLVSETHRLNSCLDIYGKTDIEKEDYFASSSNSIKDYKVLVECSHAINSYYPDQKDEYFVVKDLKRDVKYYIFDNQKYVLGNLNLIGIKDNFVFYNYCWEECSYVQYFHLNNNSEEKEIIAYPEYIDVLYRQGLPRDSEMIIHKEKALFISAHKIQELDTKTFKLTDIKVINQDKMFGRYGEMGGEFYPVYEIKDDGILFKIYKNSTESVTLEDPVLDTYKLSF